MEVSLHAVQTEDFATIKGWKTGVAELENLQENQENILCWLINHNKISVGIVYLFHINKREKTAYWNCYMEKEEICLKGLRRILELNLYDYAFDILSLKAVYCEAVCYNGLNCVTGHEWNNVRFQLPYKKINYDFKLKPHHVGYAVANLEKALETE